MPNRSDPELAPSRTRNSSRDGRYSSPIRMRFQNHLRGSGKVIEDRGLGRKSGSRALEIASRIRLVCNRTLERLPKLLSAIRRGVRSGAPKPDLSRLPHLVSQDDKTRDVYPRPNFIENDKNFPLTANSPTRTVGSRLTWPAVRHLT